MNRQQKTPNMLYLCTFLAVALTLGLANAEIYMYTDEDGKTRYTDTPPSESRFSVYQPKEGPVLQHRSGYYVSNSYEHVSRNEIHTLIDEAAQRHGVDPNLIRAIVRTESDFNVRAVSHKGAMGLMQLMPDTADHLGVDNAYSAKQNIDGGVRFIKTLLTKFNGNLDLALAAYNAGETAVDRFGGIPPFPETIQYVEKVKKYYSHFSDGRLQLASAGN
ncbi:MAG: lytic transglycosylase domain-containing protein [Bdellovibrionota bacterium]